MKDKVIFYKHDDGDLFALFPEQDFYSEPTNVKTCYAHIGQHGACHLDYAAECQKAKPDEFQDLKEELESIGYKLEVLNDLN